jgi:prophage tail gpP-like protein
MTEKLTLRVAGTDWEGWQQVVVSRALGSIPASFSVQVTETYPKSGEISIKPGDPVQVLVGGELVMTGYIDRYEAALNAGDHTVRITGRSKSQDLVDCSAFVGSKDQPSYQIKSATTLQIAKQLAAPYGVEVKSLAGEGKQLRQFNIAPGETPWEIIDRMTRYSQMIAYDMPDGSIMLAQAGTEKMASGFMQGVNVEVAETNLTMDQRFSEYEGFLISTQIFGDTTGKPPARGEIATDGAVPRFRRHILISEQTDMGKSLVHDRVQWEANRRAGRSIGVTVTCDSWRDSAGKLWAPNHQAAAEIPAVKAPRGNLTIASVTYTRGLDGEHAIVLLMPASAFQPEPAPFQPMPVGVSDVEQYNAAQRQQQQPTTEQIVSKGGT